MIAGIDFPSMFSRDNFTLRRTSGHNMYDPESLLTGEEMAQGMTYTNTARDWPDEETYHKAWAGEIPTPELLKIAPRVWIGKPLAGCVRS